MNYRAYAGLLLFALLFATLAPAQQKQQHVQLNEPDLNRPRLFEHLPAEIPVSISELNRILSGETTEGRQADVAFADNKLSPFKGTIVSAARENKMRSVVIRSTEFNGASLTLSSSTNADGTVTYRGRIISFKHGDAYELVQRDDQYVLVKKNFYEMVYE